MKIFRYQIYTILLATILCSSCKKEDSITVVPETNELNNARLKVIYASAYVIRDSVQIKINDVRVSNTFIGNSTANLPTPFPGGGLNTGGDARPFYLSVRPGDTKIFVSVPKRSSSVDSIIRFSGQATLAAGRYYSAYLTDTMVNSRLVLTEDNLSPVDTGISRFKFVNLVPNVAAVDVYFDSVLVASNIAYGAVSPEFNLVRGTVGQWELRVAGALATTPSFVRYPTGTTVSTIPNQRIMTVFAKGYNGGTLARTPVISLLYNQ